MFLSFLSKFYRVKKKRAKALRALHAQKDSSRKTKALNLGYTKQEGGQHDVAVMRDGEIDVEKMGQAAEYK